jgi:uncharacterized protein YaiI (UPF0178 family)
MTVYVDGDACPVKDEVYAVASRHRVPIVLVANKPLGVPPRTQVRMVVVGDALDAADDWIAEHVAARDVVVTADIPLAARCLAAGALVLGSNGREFTEDSIGGALAMRSLKSQLRESGTSTGGPSALTDRERSRFRMKLDELLQRRLR